jgi:VWFA-related protein
VPYRCLFWPLVLLLAPLLAPQSVPPAGAQSAQNNVIRSTTRLVQVSLVVEDARGRPISGLTGADFSLSDEGQPQSIAAFSAAATTAARTRFAFPKNVFTNRFDLTGQDPGSVTVVLFDALNTSVRDQIYVRKQILRFLQTLKPVDHVAIYALTDKLLVLHDFTQDAGALVSAVHDFSSREQGAFDASHPEQVDLAKLTGNNDWLAFQNGLNNVNGIIADQATVNRAAFTSAAIEAIAEHVAAIPGRKSLIWVSGGFPIQIGTVKIGQSGEPQLSSTAGSNPRSASGVTQTGVGPSDPANMLPRVDRDTRSLEPVLRRAILALNRVNMVMYPIDANGVQVDASMSSDRRATSAFLDSSRLTIEQETRDSSRLLADRTGGRAFFGANDIGDALRKVLQDSEHGYTLGFYPGHGKWDGRFHEIKVTTRIPGARLRYRKGYFAAAFEADSPAAVNAALREASMSPLEATGLGMIVEAKPGDTPSPGHSVQLRIAIDPRQLLLQDSADRKSGAVDLLFVQSDASGQILSAAQQHLDVRLPQPQYEFLARVGMILQRDISLDPQTSQITVVVRDAGSGALGSTNIPAAAIHPVSSSPSG